MDKFLIKLKEELLKKYGSEGIDEIVDYYKEMILDRLDNNEHIDLILMDYNIKEIVTSVGPSIYANKSGYSAKDTRKGAQSLLRVLFGGVATIPLGVLYIIFLIMMVVFVIAGIAVALAGISSILYVVMNFVFFDASLGVAIGMIGLVLMSIPLSIMVCIGLNRLSKVLSKLMLKWASSIIKRKRVSA
ncbi:hypothetical protein LJC17_00925 [Acholeplasma sp. OttesenSCG-928-E16]|nr:hypothetical protein [Acholeplasma sp. OttesenSCG-928-E16]